MFVPPRALRGLLILAAATIGVSTVASAEDRPAPSPARPDDIAQSDGNDVELIAKQFGWDVDATAHHLEAQHAFGQLINTLSLEYKDAYAGAAFAPVPDDRSQIMLKGEAPDGVRELVEKSGLPVEVVDGLKYSEQELQQRTTDIVRGLGRLGYSEVGAAVLPTGQIQVAVNADPSAAQKLGPELLDGVEITQSPDRMIQNEVIEGGVMVYATTGGSCTSGFSVRSLTTGVTGVSTAAHCSGINRYSAPGPDPSLSFRGEHLGWFGDVEWNSSPDVEIARYWAGPGDNRPVTMVWPSNGYATNMVTCVHSRVNAVRSCDQIYSTFVVSWSNWSLVANLIATNNDNTSPGDSGGPWSFGTIADGGHRGDQWIWFGVRNIFTRAALFPTALGVAVMI